MMGALGELSRRVGDMEQTNASTQSDIRTVFNMLESLATQVDRLVVARQPNMVNYIMALVAVCTFVVTIGGLALWPLHNSVGKLEKQDDITREILRDINADRFTGAEAQLMANDIKNLQYEAGYMKGYVESLERKMYGR